MGIADTMGNIVTGRRSQGMGGIKTGGGMFPAGEQRDGKWRSPDGSIGTGRIKQLVDGIRSIRDGGGDFEALGTDGERDVLIRWAFSRIGLPLFPEQEGSPILDGLDFQMRGVNGNGDTDIPVLIGHVTETGSAVGILASSPTLLDLLLATMPDGWDGGELGTDGIRMEMLRRRWELDSVIDRSIGCEVMFGGIRCVVRESMPEMPANMRMLISDVRENGRGSGEHDAWEVDPLPFAWQLDGGIEVAYGMGRAS